jgi:hypothetical protein
MRAITGALSGLWHSLFGTTTSRNGMKAIGIIILAIGLALGAYALTMNVGVDVPKRDFEFGVSTPAMRVANIDRITQRQNYMIFSGILSIVGAILLGFASMAPKANQKASATEGSPLPQLESAAPASQTSVSICPNCRHMGSGQDAVCERCASPLTI